MHDDLLLSVVSIRYHAIFLPLQVYCLAFPYPCFIMRKDFSEFKNPESDRFFKTPFFAESFLYIEVLQWEVNKV